MENVAQPDVPSVQELVKANVSAVVSDKELRKLRPNSPEYAAAVLKKFGPKEQTPTSANGEQGGEVKAKTETGSETPASGTETETDDDAKISATARNRVQELLKHRKAAEEQAAKDAAENAALKARIAELEAGKKPEKATEQPTGQSFDKPKPDPKDFKTVSEYTEAVADWKLDKREFERNQAAAANAAKEKAATAIQRVLTKGADVEKELGLKPGDFKLVVSNPDFRMYPEAHEAIQESDFGHRILFELASDDETIRQLNGMTPIQQVRMIGKLEAKFEAQSKQSKETKANVLTGAKAPSTPLKGATPTKGSVTYQSPKQIGWKAYEQQRAERRAAAGRRKT